MNEDFLTSLRQQPRPEFAAALYQRISNPMLTKTYVRRRLILASTAFAATLLVVLTVSPGARALATDFLHRIGVLSIGSRPVGDPVLIASPPPEQLAQAAATATPMSPASQSGTPMENAIAQAGFLPFLPGFLPEGYSQQSVVAGEYVDDYQVPYGMGIFVDYRGEEGEYLSIQTSRFDGREQDVPMGGTRVTETMVNGQAGVWIEGIPFRSPFSASQEMSMLLWEQGDYVLSIHTDQLSLEEVLQIAESLSQ